MSKKLYTGGEIILKALGDQDVDVIFGYPGGVTLPLYDKIYQQNKVRHILVGQNKAVCTLQRGTHVLPENQAWFWQHRVRARPTRSLVLWML